VIDLRFSRQKVLRVGFETDYSETISLLISDHYTDLRVQSTPTQ